MMPQFLENCGKKKRFTVIHSGRLYGKQNDVKGVASRDVRLSFSLAILPSLSDMIFRLLYISFFAWVMTMSVLTYPGDDREERYNVSRTFFGVKKAKNKSRLSDVHATRNGGRSSDGYSKLSSGPAGEVSIRLSVKRMS